MDHVVLRRSIYLQRLPFAVLGSIGCARANTLKNAAEIVLMNFWPFHHPLP